MSLPDGSLCCYKERGCYPVWGFSGGTPGSSGRVSRSARSQNAPLGRSQSSIGNLQSAIDNSHSCLSRCIVDLSRCYSIGMRHPR